MFKFTSSQKTGSKFNAFWRENRSLLLFISLMLVFRSAVADWNDVPTGSMQPTIEVGDRIYVDKLAYDLRIPLTQISLHKIADPQQGDIVIFESEVSQKRLVKRVIGIPGDSVAMLNNRLIVNDEPLQYSDSGPGVGGGYHELIENLNGIEHKIRVKRHSYAGTFDKVTVPEGHYLVLGDNRDNSADSRAIGFVPRKEIIGKTESVVMSLNYDNYFLPRVDRFLIDLDGV